MKVELKKEIKDCFNDICHNLVNSKEFIEETDIRSIGEYNIKSYNDKLADDWFRFVCIGTNTTGWRHDDDFVFFEEQYMWIKNIGYVYIGTDIHGYEYLKSADKSIYKDINELIDFMGIDGSLK